MIHIARKVKCQRCKQQFERIEGNYVKLSSGYAHSECEDNHQLNMKERDEFIAYICKMYNFSYPDTSWLTEMKRYHEERNYRYKAMKITLQYAFEVKKIVPEYKYRLGIIPRLYEEAKRYYQAQKDTPVIEELRQYICDKYNIEELTPMIENQINKFITKYKYTYKGILITLKFGFEYKDRVPQLEYGISFVSYLYEEARKDYKRKQQLRETKLTIEERVIKVAPKKFKPRVHQIDMSQFEEEDSE